MSLLSMLNRGPIFRFFNRLGKKRELWRKRSWLKEKNKEATLADDIAITGPEHFPLERLHIGASVEIQRLSRIWFDPNAPRVPQLKIGPRAFLGQGCILSCAEDLEIGADTLIGAYTYLLTNDHEFTSKERTIASQGYTRAPLYIGRDVWIGAHSVIRKGVTIGEGAIVGACSLVTKDIPPYEVWGGVPAKKISER